MHRPPVQGLRLALALLAARFAPSVSGGDALWCHSLGVENGLSQNFITAICQDQQGFMWFGTGIGLNRWDGYQFQQYLPVLNDATSLSDMAVLALHAGRDGKLWVGTQKGIDCFIPAANNFIRYGSLIPETWRGYSPEVDLIASDHAGNIWLAAFRGLRLYRLDPRQGKVREMVLPGITNVVLTALYVDRQDRLWVASKSGDNPVAPPYRLLLFEQASQLEEPRLPSPRLPFSLEDSGGPLTTVLEDRSNRLWFGRNGGGLWRLDDATGALDRLAVDPSNPDALAEGFVRSLGFDQEGRAWVLTWSPETDAGADPGRLYRVDPEKLTARRIQPGQRLIRPSDDSRLERLALDRSGVLWVGSNGGGLRYADVTSGGFSLFRRRVPGLPGLTSGFVRAICRGRDGVVWVGTPSGLNRVDRTEGRVEYSSPSSEGLVKLPAANVQALCEDRRGDLWIGTSGGLAVWKRPAGTVQYFNWHPDRAGGLRDNFVQVIHEGQDGRIWLGTLGAGLHEFDPETQSITNYPPVADDPHSIPSPTVFALFSDHRNRLWVGTAGGLARLESSSGPERRFARVAANAAALGGVAVLSIGESPVTPGLLWIGTPDRGLCRLDLRDQSCRFYTPQNSRIADSTVYGILTDRRGRLWMSTNRGLVRYDPKDESFETYDSHPGLQSTEFNGRAFFLAPDGEMFFGGIGGMNSFYPEEIADNQHLPNVAIAGVQVLDRRARKSNSAGTLLTGHGGAQPEVAIPYSLRDITFDFVALHYSDPAGNRCQYKLEPYDQDWNGPVTERKADYTNLDPGRYTFRVRAQSSRGLWSADEATFSFVVLPPFYATAWFRGLAVLGILAAVGAAHQWRTRGLRRRKEELEIQIRQRTEDLRTALEKVEKQARQLRELDEAKSNFFANISHELRTPLMLILGPLRDIRAGSLGVIPGDADQELQVAIRNAQRLLELVDQLLLLARFDAGQPEFDPQPMSLTEFLRETVVAFEPLARQNRVRFDLVLPNEEVRGLYDPDKLVKIVANLLSNAFKFATAGGRITLQLEVAPVGWAVLTVEDTGPGLPPQVLPHVFERFYRGGQENGSLPGTGLGLAVAKECVALHGGEISVENREAGGARFTVRLPTSPGATPVEGPNA